MEIDDKDLHREHAGVSGPGPHAGDEHVERRLARFAFVREERDREVRLLFRDVFPMEVAAAFRAAGARLISIAGERPLASEPTQDEVPPGEDTAHVMGEQGASATQSGQPREWTLRYFFSLGETVYTVTIVLPGDVPWSVAGVYPAARAIEDEIAERLGTNPDSFGRDVPAREHALDGISL